MSSFSMIEFSFSNENKHLINKSKLQFSGQKQQSRLNKKKIMGICK